MDRGDNEIDVLLGGMLPPQNIDAETVVLGSVLTVPDVYYEVVDILSPESFYDPRHKHVYQAIVNLIAVSKPYDMLMVIQELKRIGALEEVGGPHYLSILQGYNTFISNIKAHAESIRTTFIAREFIRTCHETIQLLYKGEDEVMEVASDSIMNLGKIIHSNQTGAASTIQEINQEFIKNVEKSLENPDRVLGVPSGYDQLDKKLGGWLNSELTIIAARPGMGKTAEMLNLIKNACNTEHRVLVYSLEMSKLQLAKRLFTMESSVDGARIRNRQLLDSDLHALLNASGKMKNWDLIIDDTPSISIASLRARAKAHHAKKPIKAVFLDYVQLMKGEQGVGREREISSISGGLKALAKELNVPVIALAQLSRSVETRGGDKIPQLSDLRESGALEQDADNVTFIYRPAYYGISEIDIENDDHSHINIPANKIMMNIIAKAREGELGRVYLEFDGATQKITDYNMRSFENKAPVVPFEPNDNFENDGQNHFLDSINPFQSGELPDELDF